MQYNISKGDLNGDLAKRILTQGQFHRYMSFVETGNSRIVLNKKRKGLVTNHTAFVYEDVCWEKMWEMTDHQ